MSTANPTTTDGPFDSSQTPHHRRSREEVEALAKNFVAAPVVEAPVAAKPTAKIAMAAGGVVLLAVVAIVAWPTKQEAARPAAQAESARVAAEAEQWKQRFEAERERKRKELASSKEYLERIAAADAALVGEIAARASTLSERAGPAPASADVPTPREESAKASTAPAKPAAAATQPAAATSSASTAPKTAPVPAPTTTAPQQLAKAAPAEAAPNTDTQEAPKSSCAIHVSELSSSGKLTYDAVMRMKGVRLDEETGHVFTPPVKAAGGRTVVFEVMPDGCVRVARR